MSRSAGFIRPRVVRWPWRAAARHKSGLDPGLPDPYPRPPARPGPWRESGPRYPRSTVTLLHLGSIGARILRTSDSTRSAACRAGWCPGWCRRKSGGRPSSHPRA